MNTNQTIYKEIEGIFDGLNMRGDDNHLYKVQSNYASKSKLLEGDRLILRIYTNGDMIYKVLELAIPIKFIAKFEDGKLWNKENQSFLVNPSVVTYFHLKNGDEVIALTSKNGRWATVESAIGASLNEKEELQYDP